MAFQASHARFLSGATKLNTLLDIAGMNVHEGGQTYIAADAQGASDMASVPIADAGGIGIRA